MAKSKQKIKKKKRRMKEKAIQNGTVNLSKISNKCILCKEAAYLENDDGSFICDTCAQIQGELAEM